MSSITTINTTTINFDNIIDYYCHYRMVNSNNNNNTDINANNNNAANNKTNILLNLDHYNHHYQIERAESAHQTQHSEHSQTRHPNNHEENGHGHNQIFIVTLLIIFACFVKIILKKINKFLWKETILPEPWYYKY